MKVFQPEGIAGNKANGGGGAHGMVGGERKLFNEHLLCAKH